MNDVPGIRRCCAGYFGLRPGASLVRPLCECVGAAYCFRH